MTKGNSRKAREKLADSLLSMSGALGVALTVAVLVTPLAAVATAAVSGREIDLLAMIVGLKPSTAGLLIVLYLVAVAMVMGARHAALRIYNDLYPDT